jgi:hypothetical protein
MGFKTGFKDESNGFSSFMGSTSDLNPRAGQAGQWPACLGFECSYRYGISNYIFGLLT